MSNLVSLARSLAEELVGQRVLRNMAFTPTLEASLRLLPIRTQMYLEEQAPSLVGVCSLSDTNYLFGSTAERYLV